MEPTSINPLRRRRHIGGRTNGDEPALADGNAGAKSQIFRDDDSVVDYQVSLIG